MENFCINKNKGLSKFLVNGTDTVAIIYKIVKIIIYTDGSIEKHEDSVSYADENIANRDINTYKNTLNPDLMKNLGIKEIKFKLKNENIILK